MRASSWKRIGSAALGALLALGVLPMATSRAEPAAPAQAGGASWTMLVYMVADNNLELDALLDLEEIAEAAGPGANFLVLMDRTAKDWGDGQYPDEQRLGIDAFTGARLLNVTADGIEVLEELGEIDMVDPQNLAWFVWYGLENFPAERTGLVMWDHGGAAIVPFGADDDNGGAEFLSLPELQQGIGSALEAAGGQRLDFIGFDACLMATTEVARAMAPFAELYVASQEVEPGHGWDWTSMSVLQDAGTDERDLAAAVLAGYEQHVADLSGVSDYTLSAIDLDAMAQVDDALAGFVSAVGADPASGTALLQARQSAIEFYTLAPDPADHPQQVDLVDLIARLPEGLPSNVLVARNALAAAVDAAVLDSVVGPSHAGAQGLAIHLPKNGAYYTSLYDDHADPTGWRELIKEILEGQGAGGGGGPSVDGDLDLEVQPEGWRGTVHLAEGLAAEIAGGTGIFGVPGDDGTALALAFLPAELGAGAPDDLQTAWSYQYLRLDGTPVSIGVTPMADGFRAAVYGVYVDPSGNQLEATLSMDLSLAGAGLQVGNYQLVGNSGGVAGPITPQPGARFAPTQVVVSGADIVREDLLPAFDLASFEIAVAELVPGDRFYASVVAFLPDGSSAARSAVSSRP